jgi:hypothetical protein
LEKEEIWEDRDDGDVWFLSDMKWKHLRKKNKTMEDEMNRVS